MFCLITGIYILFFYLQYMGSFAVVTSDHTSRTDFVRGQLQQMRVSKVYKTITNIMASGCIFKYSLTPCIEHICNDRWLKRLVKARWCKYSISTESLKLTCGVDATHVRLMLSEVNKSPSSIYILCSLWSMPRGVEVCHRGIW